MRTLGEKGNLGMSDLDDFELNEQAPDLDVESQTQSPDESGGRRRLAIVVAILVVLVAVVGGWLWSRQSRVEPLAESAEGAVEQIVEPPSVEMEEEAEPIDLPELDASDIVVRELAAALSAHPEFAAWLVNDELVRRFVVAADNIAEGETPRVHLGFMAPESGFRTWESEGGLHVSPTSYRRYDPITEAFISLDSEGSIELYRQLEPLAQQAYRDLGYPERRFEDVVRAAAQVVLDTPRTTGPVKLEAAVRSYRFADPRLEELAPVQKQLLRFGPRNLTKIQEKVQALLDALDSSQP